MYLLIETLAECETKADLQDALENLPPTIEDTYLRCMTRTKGGKFVCNPRVLKWVSAAYEPLTISHLCEMLAIDTDTGEYHPEKKPTTAAVVRSGVSLLFLERTNKYFVPIHHSARQFILSDLMDQEMISPGLCAAGDSSGEQGAVLEIAQISILHIQSRTSLHVAKIQEILSPPIHGLVHRSIRTLLPMYKKTYPVSMTVPTRSPALGSERTEFLNYAIQTWP